MAPAIPGNTSRNDVWWARALVRSALVLAVGISLIVALGAAQRLGWIKAGGGVAAAPGGGDVIYTCPMHPEIRQPAPGRCPICGMPLVLAASAGAGQDELAVQIEPAARRLANIQTAKAELTSVERAIRTAGVIAYDESRLATLSAYVDGRLERLFADYTGVSVAKGDHLVRLYSPMLFAAQAEFVYSRSALEKPNPTTLPDVQLLQRRLAVSARQKLIEFGMTEEQVAELEKTGKPQGRLTIYSPIGGTVTEKPKVEGDYVKTGDVIYRVANLGTVWIKLKLFPDDAAAVRFGQGVETEVHSLPGQVFTGRVAFIDPFVSEKTRTVDVRVELLNLEGRLRPGDFATGLVKVPVGPQGQVYDVSLAGKWISPMHPQIIRDEAGKCPICGMDLVPTSQYGYSDKPVGPVESLVIPRDAVLMMGANSIVYVETEPGRFEIRPVVLGSLTDTQAVVLSGLKEGESVATSGNFLIDSQMQLTGKPSLIDPSRVTATRNAPVELDAAKQTVLPGETGRKLETVYVAYLKIQSALAADEPVGEPLRDAIVESAAALAEAKDLPDDLRTLVHDVQQHADHLHHMELNPARQSFKKLSQAVLRMAIRARGSEASTQFVHFFCTMKHDGGGRDWMQPVGEHNDPYCGKEMPGCGKALGKLPMPIENKQQEHSHEAHSQSQKTN